MRRFANASGHSHAMAAYNLSHQCFVTGFGAPARDCWEACMPKIMYNTGKII